MNVVSTDFVREIINTDNVSGKFKNRVHTRFPPEPNGYLHIGHAKSICLNFTLAQEFGGKCNLRFDDTNPAKEDQEYVDAIKADVAWLGFKWDAELFASDYYEQLYLWAVQLIKDGKAYVDDLSENEMKEYRGTSGGKGLTPIGKNSPFRERSVEENLKLFAQMRAGEFADGSKTLRAKIDMAHPNLNMRDPVMYRILRAHHHRTGDKWCIYPMYDYTHGQSDSLEQITHSICTLEFENHRPLYDWYLDALKLYHPQQIEFARLNLTHTVLSKRRLLTLVKENHVDSWDDPRMPTISGFRRRGFTPTAIRNFCAHISVSKVDSRIDTALLEHFLRDDLNKKAQRLMAVLRPLKIVITNYPENQTENLSGVNNPEDANAGTREIPFSREIYIERDDFMENPPKKFFRLSVGAEVRLRYAYYIKCESVIKNAAGEIVELHCTYDEKTRGGDSPDGRKVKATLHWVCAKNALVAEARLYEQLFTVENPEAEKDNWLDFLNPQSREIIPQIFVEPFAKKMRVGENLQFERVGYFAVDKNSTPEKMVFNRTVSLKGAKI